MSIPLSPCVFNFFVGVGGCVWVGEGTAQVKIPFFFSCHRLQILCSKYVHSMYGILRLVQQKTTADCSNTLPHAWRCYHHVWCVFSKVPSWFPIMWCVCVRLWMAACLCYVSSTLSSFPDRQCVLRGMLHAGLAALVIRPYFLSMGGRFVISRQPAPDKPVYWVYCSVMLGWH